MSQTRPKKKKTEDDLFLPMMRCPECGYEQPDMGIGVKCENCGYYPLEKIKETGK